MSANMDGQITFTVEVPQELAQSFLAVAEQTDCSASEALLVAISEYVIHWQTHLADLHQISEEERRAVLAADGQ